MTVSTNHNFWRERRAEVLPLTILTPYRRAKPGIETGLFFLFFDATEADAPHLRAWFDPMLLSQSYYPNLSEGADSPGGQMHGDKVGPFFGRVWRKVPENGAWSVVTAKSWQSPAVSPLNPRTASQLISGPLLWQSLEEGAGKRCLKCGDGKVLAITGCVSSKPEDCKSVNQWAPSLAEFGGRCRKTVLEVWWRQSLGNHRLCLL